MFKQLAAKVLALDPDEHNIRILKARFSSNKKIVSADHIEILEGGKNKLAYKTSAGSSGIPGRP